MQTVTIIINKAPYGTTTVGEGLRAGIALAGMDIQTNIILTEDAVFTALKQQDPTAIKAASLHEALANAREFGARTYVHVESLAQRGIGKQELIDIESIDTAGLAGMIEQAEATLTF